MNCEAVLNVEDLYAEDRLTEGRARQVREHVESCEVCVSRIKAGRLSLRKTVRAPKELKDRMKALFAKFESVEMPKAPAPSFFDGELWPVAASIAVYFAAALFLAWQAPGATSQLYDRPAAEVTK
jgi:hypothetical protein